MPDNFTFLNLTGAPKIRYVWATYGTGYDNQETKLLRLENKTISISWETQKPFTQVLLTLVEKGPKPDQWFIVGSARLFPPSGIFVDMGLNQPSSASKPVPLRRVNARSLTIENVSAAVQAPSFWGTEIRHSHQARQDAKGLHQDVAACADGTCNVTLTYGHPWLKCGPWFAGRAPAQSGLWERYVQRALLLTGFKGLDNTDKSFSTIGKCELDLLLAVALQAPTGIYQQERADDRKCEELTFGTNGDCDDQACTVAALIDALIAEDVQTPLTQFSNHLHKHLKDNYCEAAVMVGFARKPSNLNAAPFGHSWACVTRSKGNFAKALHVEPTAPLTCLSSDCYDAERHNPTRWPLVYSNNEYNRLSSLCFDRMKELKVNANRLVGVRKAETSFYGAPCTATTRDAQYTWPRSFKTPWLAVIRPGHSVVNPQKSPLMGQDPKELHHLPNRLMPQHLPIGYNQINFSTKVDCLENACGFVYGPLQKPAKAHCVVDPFNILVPVPKA